MESPSFNFLPLVRPMLPFLWLCPSSARQGYHEQPELGWLVERSQRSLRAGSSYRRSWRARAL